MIRSTLVVRVKCDKLRNDRLELDLSFKYIDYSIADLVVEVAWS